MAVPRIARLDHVFTVGLRDAFSEPLCNCSVRTTVPETTVGTPCLPNCFPATSGNSAFVSNFMISSPLKASLSWRLEDLCVFQLTLSLRAVGNLVTETAELFCVRCGNVAALELLFVLISGYGVI